MNSISEIPFGLPVQVPQTVKIDETEKHELKHFDDLYYQHYRENKNFIPKEDLFQILINDITEYLKTVPSSNEIRVGYILYSKFLLSSSKMNNVLNLLIQKINPNIRVLSVWNVESSYKGPLQTVNGNENVDFDKIRVKLLIRPNDKDIAIKKLIEMNLHSLKKSNKKLNDYLAKYNT
jgi:hypothetical protein